MLTLLGFEVTLMGMFWLSNAWYTDQITPCNELHARINCSVEPRFRLEQQFFSIWWWWVCTYPDIGPNYSVLQLLPVGGSSFCYLSRLHGNRFNGFTPKTTWEKSWITDSLRFTALTEFYCFFFSKTWCWSILNRAFTDLFPYYFEHSPDTNTCRSYENDWYS